MESLIIVGNGPSALNKSIDQYDIIVRIGCYVLCKEVGENTDIVLRRSWQPTRAVSQIWMPEPVLSKDQIIPDAERLGPEKYQCLIEKLNLPSNVHPSAGMIAIEMALYLYNNTHRINICGFDQFKDGWYWDPDHSHITPDILHSPVHEHLLINKYTITNRIHQL